MFCSVIFGLLPAQSLRSQSILGYTKAIWCLSLCHDAPHCQENPKIPTELVRGEPTVLRHALPTSGVIYTDVAFDLSRVPVELIPLVPLFTRALKQLGTVSCPEVGEKWDITDLSV